jgi:serine/threonine-protein kinase RsbW
VLHAGRSVHAYEVEATVGAAGCRVEVTDDEVFSPGPAAAGDLAESGRGFAVMRACVDGVWLRSAPGHGTSVVLDKRIRWQPPVPVPA